jgi:hypothetical protein
MRKVLVISILALCSAPAGAAANAHCDATPFTLGKPAAAKAQSDQPKPQLQPKRQPKRQAVQAAAKKPVGEGEGKQRLLASCKSGKKKKSA